MTEAYQDSLDIANRALFNLGLPAILSVTEDSLRNSTMSLVYDQLREEELRRNNWKFAKRRVLLRPISTSSRLLAPHAWEAQETYLPGSIVADTNGAFWISWRANNYGNEPGASDAWDAYYGPMTVDPWTSSTTYGAGELVYSPLAYNGSFGVFISLQSGNSDDPETAVAWAAGTTYNLNDRVSYGGFMWRSLITLNLGVTPLSPPANYSSGVTYGIGDKAVASDGYVYTATTGATLGINPIDDDGTFWTHGVPAAWSHDPLQYSASPKWLPLFAGMTNISGDWQYVTADSGESVFHLPSGFLRRVRLRSGVRRAADGTELIGKFITGPGPIMTLEFIANVRLVTTMDPMFCGGLAARMALSTSKKLIGTIDNSLAQLYGKFMTEARQVNAVEAVPEEADEDEYMTARESGSGGYSNGGNNYGRNW